MSELTNRQPQKLTIGGISLYCEGFKASAVIDYVFKPAVSGLPIITNQCRKFSRIVFFGRVYRENQSLFFCQLLNYLQGTQKMKVKYKNLSLTGCYLEGYTIDETNEDYMNYTVTLSTLHPYSLNKEDN